MMEAGKHTSGPWTAVDNSWEASSVYADEGETLVAEVHINSSVDEDTQSKFESIKEANARLIAAAPELLVALKDAQKTLQTASRQLTEDHKMVLMGRSWGWKTIATIEGAIAKAERNA